MILNAKFDLDNFSQWIEDFLPDFVRDFRKVEIPSSFSDVKSITTLGESNLGVRVFVIETLKDPSGRKVGLAKDSFNLIKNYGTPNALIVYHSESSENWRFSLLTSTPSWNEGKIITKLSNPKRHSYVLGPKAKTNTPEIFLNKRGNILDFEDLKSRFSLEVVNKEFYKEISESFTKLVGGTRGEGKNKKTYESVLKLPSTNDHSLPSIEFAVRLIGRVIFCWFLREKISESGSSLMPKELLSLSAISENSDYYHKILEPIFFEVLNKPIKSRKDSYDTESFSQIPYLNGGLFSPHDDDFFSYNEGKQAQFHNTVVVPDKWFKEFFSILETYNFTIDENTSIDEDLSIDPEMLGRIFENLLAEINPETGESARKSTGSYYTPRVIVDYMVDESLLLYIKQKTTIDEDKLRAIISYDLSDDILYPLNEDEKKSVVDAIEKVKILDPACGSGAFPIGALQKIVFILQQIDPDGQIWFHKQIQHTSPEIRRVIEREFSHENFDYIRKLGVIRENIYGIDIQPIATEIARLRCFLTLVVDERVDDTQENRGIEPLPNLDFKFVTANSLIGLPTSNKANQIGLFEDTEGIAELREIRDMFFTASGSEREQLKLQFVQIQNKMFQRLISENRRGHAELTQMLTTWDPFSHTASAWFDIEWMFGIKEGFDIVIANPPYVRQEKIKDFKELFKNRFRVFNSTSDLYTYFYELSAMLLKERGYSCFISSNKWMRSKYGLKLREFFKFHTSIARVIDFGGYPVFEATVDTNILIFCKDKPTESHNFGFKNIDSTILRDSLIEEINGLSSVYQSSLEKEGWTLADQAVLGLKEKIGHTGTSLNKLGNKIYRGIITGFNEGFIIDSTTKEKLCSVHPSSKEVLEKVLRGKDIKKYGYDWSNLWIIVIKSGWTDENRKGQDPEEFFKQSYPAVYEHLILMSKNGGKGKGLFERDDKGDYWWELRDCDYYNEFNNHKIVYKDIAQRLTFTIDNSGHYLTNTAYFITGYKLNYIVPILNSKLLDWYFRTISSQLGAKGVRHFSIYIEQLPIPHVSQEEQDLLSAKAEEIISLVSNNERMNEPSLNNQITKIEKELDRKIYELYKLTDEEIAIVEDKK